MENLDREDLVNWLNKLGERDEVVNLKIEDLHLYPVLRWVLFSDFKRREGYKRGQKKITTLKKISNKIYKGFFKIFGFFYFLKLKYLESKPLDVLFSGADVYRLYYNNQFINRYFYPMLDWMEKNNILFGFADYKVNNFKDYPYQRHHINIRAVHQFCYSFKKKKVKFRNEILTQEILLSIIEEYNQKFASNIKLSLFKSNVENILTWAEVYGLLLERHKPKLILLLCYYDNAMYGLNLAAYKRNIKSVDVQHGSQGILHPSYSGFFNVPNSGYSCLPRYFWLWDKMSYKGLGKRLNNSKHHKVIMGGNPWIKFLKENSSQIQFPKLDQKIILYSLQPFLPFVPEIIINALKMTPTCYTWWFRLHPRMTEKDFQEIQAQLEKENLKGRVNFNDATSLPLPLILNNTTVHITKSSGCILEANLIGVPSIIIDPLGENYFNDLIDNENNYYINSGSLWPTILKIGHKENNKKPFDFVPVLEKLLA